MNEKEFLNLSNLNASSHVYSTNKPFPHIVLDNAWDENFLSDVVSEFNLFSSWDGEKNFFGSEKKKICSTYKKFPKNIKTVIDILNGEKFLIWLKNITGENELIADPYLYGGGLHSIGNGGFLKIHADYNWHEKMKLFRRLNLLFYLNKDWKDHYNGNLELWSNDMSSCEKSISPKFNRMVIFTTDDKSYHGHPKNLNCPDDVRRNSIALYYYSSLKPKKNFSGKRIGTDYIPTDNDKFERPGFVRRAWGKIKYEIKYLLEKK